MTASPILAACLKGVVCLAALALTAKAEGQTASSSTVTLTLNVNLNLANLHPSVKRAEVRCTAQGATSSSNGISVAIVDNGYVGPASVNLSFPVDYFLTHPDHTVTPSCNLWFQRYSPTPTKEMARASADGPVPQAEANWTVVASSSKISWVQTVTIPNAATP